MIWLKNETNRRIWRFSTMEEEKKKTRWWMMSFIDLIGVQKKRKHSQIDRRRTNEVLSGEREKRTKKSLREWLFSSERFVRSLWYSFLNRTLVYDYVFTLFKEFSLSWNESIAKHLRHMKQSSNEIIHPFQLILNHIISDHQHIF